MTKADFERKYCRCDAMLGVTCGLHADLASLFSETSASEVDRLRTALHAVKVFVVGEKSPNWHDDAMTYMTRGKIADICDFALAHPNHPRDVHLTVEKR